MQKRNESEYSRKCRDPRWQKIRLKVFERDQFSCQCCSQTETELHVHHINYPKTGNPWDSEIDDLITVCKFCHSEIEAMIKRFRKASVLRFHECRLFLDRLEDFDTLLGKILWYISDKECAAGIVHLVSHYSLRDASKEFEKR